VNEAMFTIIWHNNINWCTL